MTRRYLKTPEEVTKALKEGKVVETKINKYKLIDGIICGFHKQDEQWMLGHSIFEYENAYIEEPEPFKLEVGKFYKTRRGDKVVCLCHRGDYYIHRLNSYIVGYWVDKTGRMLFNGVPERTETDSDVVALWEDEHK